MRRELNAEEEKEISQGILPLHQTSATQFLVTGLEIEEQQYVLSKTLSFSYTRLIFLS